MDKKLRDYYETYQRMDYGGNLWNRMMETLSAEDQLKLARFSTTAGKYVNETGERIERKFQHLAPRLAEKTRRENHGEAFHRWLQDEFLRNLLQEEMRQCPVEGISLARQLQHMIESKPRNRLVQTVYALVAHCNNI